MRFLLQQRGRFLVSTWVAAAGLLLASCSTPGHVSAPGPQPYTRIFRPETNTVQLQIAARKFTPVHHRGPTVWLVGASHIGDKDYYQALQRHLDAQTLVLFEGVNAEAHKRRVNELTNSPSPSAKFPSRSAQSAEPPGIQTTLAESLGLVFQLDAINYDRTNFLNSDVSIQELERLMGGDPGPSVTATNSAGLANPTRADDSAVPDEAPGETVHSGLPVAPNASFNYLMQAMDGSSFLGSIMRVAVQFLGSSSSLRAITKLTFIETLGQLNGDLTAMRGMPPDVQQLLKVLIEARNRQVIEDLQKESRVVPRSGSIAIFYGTGHMDDMEKRLVNELHYRPAGDVRFTAFSVDVRQTGLSHTQLQMVQNLIKWQMDQLRP